MAKNDNKRKANDDHDEDDYEEDNDADADFSNSSSGSQGSDSDTSRKKMNSKTQKASAGRRSAPRKKKPYRTQASLSSRAVLDHVRAMFERQSQLWKQHADAMEKAVSSNDDTGTIAQQQPWHGLLTNNRSIAAGNTNAKSAAIEDLTRSLSSIQNRTYTRQAKPGQDHDSFEPSSSEDDDESDNG
jgi:hypothetical protein